MIMKQFLKKILSWNLLFAVLAGLFLGLTVYRLNVKIVARNELPMPFGVGVATVLTGSMEPTISAGDMIFVKKADDFAVGDIVVYQDGSMLVVHEIIDIDGDIVTTKGEANNIADAPISLSAIKGKVFFIVPGVGMILDFLRNPIVMVALLALALFLLERSYRRDELRDKEELDRLRDEIRELSEE